MSDPKFVRFYTPGSPLNEGTGKKKIFKGIWSPLHHHLYQDHPGPPGNITDLAGHGKYLEYL